MLLGEDHRGVEPDDREPPRDREDRLDDLLADVRVQEVELRGVVPREARPVVAVVDVALVARPSVEALEHDGGVAVVPVVVLEDDPDPRVGREVGAAERVGGVGRLVEREEPLRVLDHPARVDAHVVGDHVARQADAARPGAVAQRRVRRLAAEVVGDPVVVERVGRGDRVGVAAHPLDPLRRRRTLPEPDEPQPGDAPARERVELLVRDRVERPDVATVGPGELVEPDVGALGHQHDARHPGRVGRERLGLLGRRRRRTAPRSDRPAVPPKRRWRACSSSARIPSARSSRAIRAASASPSSGPQWSRM